MNADERRSIGFADGARARCRLCGHQHPDFSDIVTVGASTEGRFSTIGEAISGPKEIGPRRAQEKSVEHCSTGANMTHDAHLKAAEQHELAAQAHRTAAEHHEKGDDVGGRWHAARALEFSDHAYKLAKEAHNKSGQMVTL